MKKNNNMIAIIVKVIGVLASIAAIITTVIAYLDFKSEKTNLKITNIEIYEVDEIFQERDMHYVSENSKYVENLLKSFESAYVFFNLENHSNVDTEIYGFYFEIIVSDKVAPILVPLDSYSRRDNTSVDVFMVDWEAVEGVEYYVAGDNSTHEFAAALEDYIECLESVWFWRTEFPNQKTALENYLEEAYINENSLECKCRIVCRDTFNNYYYSESEEFILKYKK